MKRFVVSKAWASVSPWRSKDVGAGLNGQTRRCIGADGMGSRGAVLPSGLTLAVTSFHNSISSAFMVLFRFCNHDQSLK